MIEKTVVVKSDAGVHARPAMMFVREAMKYSCEVFLVKDDIEANGKSIMSVLGLAITSGTRLLIRAEGTDEENAVDNLVALIENDFKN
jgi:phosphotransferase system HPr (HPr) family protein